MSGLPDTQTLTFSLPICLGRLQWTVGPEGHCPPPFCHTSFWEMDSAVQLGLPSRLLPAQISHSPPVWLY